VSEVNDNYKPYWGDFIDEKYNLFHIEAVALSKEDFIVKTELMCGKKIKKHNISFFDDGTITNYGWEKRV